MAKLIKLSNTKWKQPFIDRAKEYQLWTIPRDVTEYCGIEVGQNRKIHISFDPKLNVPDIEQYFHITTNIWISFPKDIQRIISNIAPNNRSSYFIAEVVDINVTTQSPEQTRIEGLSMPTIPSLIPDPYECSVKENKLKISVRDALMHNHDFDINAEPFCLCPHLDLGETIEVEYEVHAKNLPQPSSGTDPARAGRTPC